VDDLDFVLVDEFVEEDYSLVVPDLNLAVLTSSGNQSEVVSVSTTDDVLLVAVRFATLDHLTGCLMMHNLVHVHLDRAVPAARNDCMVLTAIANEGDLTICSIVLL